MRHSLAIAVLAALAVVYLWPLEAQLTTAFPGGPTDRDVATMVWNVGWVQHALISGSSLLRTDDVLVPFGADLRLHTYGLLQSLLASPLVPVVGAIGAFNLMLLLSVLLNGLAVYALAVREPASRSAALVAGACFMLATPVLDQMRVGRPTFASLWLVAAALLVMRSLLAAPRVWHGVVLGALVAAALLTDLQIALYVALWLAVYSVWRARARHALPLALGGAVAAACFVIVFAPAFLAGGYPRPSLADMAVYSFRLWDFADPSVLEHAAGIELAIGIAAALVWRKASVWLIGSVLFVLLSLGPLLQPTNVVLPFAAFSLWSPLAQFRTPYRLAMPAALGLCVVLAMLLARIKISSRIAVALVAVRLAAALWLEPFPTQTYPSYATYQRIASEPGRFALLEVPFGVRSGLEQIGDGGEVLEIYQHIHGKPLLNGMIARVPSAVFAAYREHPALLLLSGQDVPASVDDLRTVIDWTSTRYILVHGSLLSADQRARATTLLAQVATLVGTEQDLMLYEVSH